MVEIKNDEDFLESLKNKFKKTPPPDEATALAVLQTFLENAGEEKATEKLIKLIFITGWMVGWKDHKKEVERSYMEMFSKHYGEIK
jgi:hypothetical protein